MIPRDKPLVRIPRCKRCGRAKNQHRAKTLECPKGKRTKVGYTRFGTERYLEKRK